MSDQDTIAGDELSPEEKAYFDNRGEGAQPGAPVDGATPPPNDEGDGGAPTQAGDGAAPVADSAAKAPDKSTEDSRKVDYRALREEREKRYALEGQLAQMQQRFQLVDQRLAMIQQAGAANQQPQQSAGLPDPDADIFSSVRYLNEKLTSIEKAEQDRRRAEVEQVQVNRYINDVFQRWANLATETAKVEPDLADAYNYVIGQRKKELVASGMSPSQSEVQARHDELVFVDTQMRNNRHPAYALMEIARARGWQPKQKGAEPVPATERLETVARGQDANRSLSTVGTGGASRGRIDTKALAEMSEEEFTAFLTKNGEKGFKAALSR